MTPDPRRAGVWVALLAALYAAVLMAGPIAPYAPGDQNRDLPFAPPTRLHVVGPPGRLHLRPFVYRTVGRPGRTDEYEEDRNQAYPVRFLPHGAPYTIAGIIAADRHLFGVDAPATVFLFGSDQFGRDLFSRVLFGGQVSLVAGVLARAWR
jgi:peptide/nickel transport system permease protein